MPKSKKKSTKKDKKLRKIIENNDSGDESEHELSYYINDRVKLMKEVLKIIPAKKIKSMAPDCIKVRIFSYYCLHKFDLNLYDLELGQCGNKFHATGRTVGHKQQTIEVHF